MSARVTGASTTGGLMATLAASAVQRLLGVALPASAVAAAFRLLGLRSISAQARFFWQMLLAPSPGMRRLRRRAVRAVRDYQALMREAPQLRGLLKLDFTILLSLYGDALGVSRRQALDAGLVEVYCHLAALVDAYDDLLDTPQARQQPLAERDFLTGETGRLRRNLVEHLEERGRTQPNVLALVADLAAFERAALAAHLALDVGAGLEAPLAAVVRARAATSGLLLRFAAHLWSVLLDLPAPLAASSEQAAETFGLVAQFADDVIDWTQDDGSAQNLLGAALLQQPLELAAMRAAATRITGFSLPVDQVQRLAPRSLALLRATRDEVNWYPVDPRYRELKQFGDDVYSVLLPMLPAVDFRELDAIRQEVQTLLVK